MASSSSSSNPQWAYDVFLNFRGSDTRTSFVSHLYSALSNAGINTFLDQELSKGTELQPEILRAIETSHMSVVVFSKSYTESCWCLNELETIMECHRVHGQVVVPVFYDVEPSVVRHQKGAFGEALETLVRKRCSGSGLKYVRSSWKTALTEAANLTGWDVTKYR